MLLPGCLTACTSICSSGKAARTASTSISAQATLPPAIVQRCDLSSACPVLAQRMAHIIRILRRFCRHASVAVLLHIERDHLHAIRRLHHLDVLINPGLKVQRQQRGNPRGRQHCRYDIDASVDLLSCTSRGLQRLWVLGRTIMPCSATRAKSAGHSSTMGVATISCTRLAPRSRRIAAKPAPDAGAMIRLLRAPL